MAVNIYLLARIILSLLARRPLCSGRLSWTGLTAVGQRFLFGQQTSVIIPGGLYVHVANGSKKGLQPKDMAGQYTGRACRMPCSAPSQKQGRLQMCLSGLQRHLNVRGFFLGEKEKKTEFGMALQSDAAIWPRLGGGVKWCLLF